VKEHHGGIQAGKIIVEQSYGTKKETKRSPPGRSTRPLNHELLQKEKQKWPVVTEDFVYAPYAQHVRENFNVKKGLITEN